MAEIIRTPETFRERWASFRKKKIISRILMLRNLDNFYSAAEGTLGPAPYSGTLARLPIVLAGIAISGVVSKIFHNWVGPNLSAVMMIIGSFVSVEVADAREIRKDKNISNAKDLDDKPFDELLILEDQVLLDFEISKSSRRKRDQWSTPGRFVIFLFSILFSIVFWKIYHLLAKESELLGYFDIFAMLFFLIPGILSGQWFWQRLSPKLRNLLRLLFHYWPVTLITLAFLFH